MIIFKRLFLSLLSLFFVLLFCVSPVWATSNNATKTLEPPPGKPQVDQSSNTQSYYRLQLSSNRAYPGEPVYIKVTTNHHLTASFHKGTTIELARPILIAKQEKNGAAMHFVPYSKISINQIPTLSSGEMESSIWRLQIPKVGKHSIVFTIYVNSGNTSAVLTSLTLNVIPLPKGVRNPTWAPVNIIGNAGFFGSVQGNGEWHYSYNINVNNFKKHAEGVYKKPVVLQFPITKNESGTIQLTSTNASQVASAGPSFGFGFSIKGSKNSTYSAASATPPKSSSNSSHNSPSFPGWPIGVLGGVLGLGIAGFRKRRRSRNDYVQQWKDKMNDIARDKLGEMGQHLGDATLKKIAQTKQSEADVQYLTSTTESEVNDSRAIQNVARTARIGSRVINVLDKANSVTNVVATALPVGIYAWKAAHAHNATQRKVDTADAISEGVVGVASVVATGAIWSAGIALAGETGGLSIVGAIAANAAVSIVSHVAATGLSHLLVGLGI